jgi:hypothetical protein
MSDYNGWKNRETWLVNLWLGDDEYLKEQVNSLELGDAVKLIEHHVDEIVEHYNVSGFVGDLMSGAVARIDFYDIVKAWKED